mgnify:CR=1 FL=1
MLETWANLTMDELVYHLNSPLEGTNSDMIWQYVFKCIVPTIIIIMVITAIVINLKKKKKKTEAVLHHSPEGHIGGKQETTDLWHLSVERIREASEREHRKINSSNQQFLYFLLKLFLALMILGSAIMFLTWKVLENYEKSTPNGAMSAYVHLLQANNYDKIYENSTVIFTQFNEKEPYIEYLKSIYEDVNLKKAVFSKKAYSNDTFLYYDMIVDFRYSI